MIVRESYLLTLGLFLWGYGGGGAGSRMAVVTEAFVIRTKTGPLAKFSSFHSRLNMDKTNGINGSHNGEEHEHTSAYSVLGTSSKTSLPSFSAPSEPSTTATNGEHDPFSGHEYLLRETPNDQSYPQKLLRHLEQEQQLEQERRAAVAAAISMSVDGNGTGSLMGRSVTNGGRDAPLMVTNLRNAFPVDSGRPKPSELARIKSTSVASTPPSSVGRTLTRYDPSVHKEEYSATTSSRHQGSAASPGPRLKPYDLATNPSLLGLATGGDAQGKRRFSSLDNTGVTISTGSAQNYGRSILKRYQKEEQGEANYNNRMLPGAKAATSTSDDSSDDAGPRLKHYDLATNPSVLGLAETFLKDEQKQHRLSMADSTGVTIGAGLEPNKGKKLAVFRKVNNATSTLSKDLYYTKWIGPTDATMARKTGLTVNKPISLWTERDKFLDYEH